MYTDLIPQALIIGSVQAAVYWTEEGVKAIRLEKENEFVDCSRQASLLLDLQAENRLLTKISHEQLHEALAFWSRSHRVLNFLIGGMDTGLSDKTRRLGLELAEQETLANPYMLAFARNRLLGCILPEDADIQGAERLSKSLKSCLSIFRDLSNVRQYIKPVTRVLKNLIFFEFPLLTSREEFYRDLVDRSDSESSAEIAKRVARSREIQLERYKGTKIHCNAQMTPRFIKKYCELDASGNRMLELV
ncbi:MAG: hypothetical protein WCL71_15445, partial [Deltaproteobacteria bacterium]